MIDDDSEGVDLDKLEPFVTYMNKVQKQIARNKQFEKELYLIATPASELSSTDLNSLTEQELQRKNKDEQDANRFKEILRSWESESKKK